MSITAINNHSPSVGLVSMNICGAICGHTAAMPDAHIRPGFHTARFNNGALASDEPVIHEADDGLYCVATGEPRFPSSLGTQESSPAEKWLAAFRKWGDQAPAHASGRFAAAIVNPASRTVLIATDKFATYPICYAEASDRFCFASRADEVPFVDRKISHQAIFSYLFFHVIPAPATIFENVKRMQPAETLKWQDGKLKRFSYWTPSFVEDRKPDLQETQQQFRDVVERAVAREGAGDGVGAFLSGGTDSSTLSGMLCKVKDKAANTYSIGFDTAGYDEMEYARIAARHFGTNHHEYYVTANDLGGGIEKIAGYYDQPFGNSSAVPALICAERAKADGIDKLLAGDGGDELFGGNTRYAKQRVFDWYWKLPRWARKGVLEPCVAPRAAGSVPLLKKVRSYVQQASIPMPDRIHSYNMLLRLGTDSVLEPDFLQSIDQDWPFAIQRKTWDANDARSLINRMLAYDWKFTLADSDLPKVIGSAQAAGVGVGFPFLADEVVDFSLALPPKWKLKGSQLRWFFKEALKDFLPDEIINKKKHGFGLPFGVWALEHQGLKQLSTQTVMQFGERGIARPAFLHELLNQHLPQHPGYYGEMVWILMMLELWLQKHLPN